MSSNQKNAEALAGFVAGGAIALLQAWFVMLSVGALHSFAGQVPAISYPASVWLMVVVYLVMAPVILAGQPRR